MTETHGHLSDVLLLEEIDRLKNIVLTHAVRQSRVLKETGVFPQLHRVARGVDLWDRTWFEFVHQLAKKNSIVETLAVVIAGELLSSDRFDPFSSSLFLFGIALGIDLRTTSNNRWLSLSLSLSGYFVLDCTF